MHNLDHDLALLQDVAEEAARIGKRYFRKNPEAWDKAGGQGPVTEADLAIDRMLQAELLSARPEYGWLSEESADPADRSQNETVFIVDPIDGTRAFMKGETGYAHALAISHQGKVVAGLVHMPQLDRVYKARLGGGAVLNGDPIAASDRSGADGAALLVNRSSLDPAHWPGGVPDVKTKGRASLAHRLCLAASGRYDGLITLRKTWEWDAAPADVILREAGARITAPDGSDLRYNQADPRQPGLIAAGPVLHADLIHRLGGSAIAPGKPGA